MTAYSRLIGAHEGKECALMLSGAKPLSLFYVEGVDEDSREFPKVAFDEQVSLGRFAKRATQKTSLTPQGTSTDSITVLYSLADQAWRMGAFLSIADLYHSFGPGFRPGLDRLIGNLLGYTPEQIEAFISRLSPNGAYD
jgi:hypothetical protein